MQRSEYLQGQLAELPLWLTGERSGKFINFLGKHILLYILAKSYQLFSSHSLPCQSKPTKNEKIIDEKVEFIPDNLLVQLNSLNLGQIAASDSEDEDDEHAAEAVSFYF